MTIDDELTVLLPDFLARQRWYVGAEPPGSVEIIDELRLAEGPDDQPGLLWLLVRVPGDDAAYQVPVGLRPLDQMEKWLQGKGRSLIGDLDDDDRPLLAYDAMIDPELVPLLLEQAAPGAVEDTTTRALAVEQSNTSVIIGEEVVLKLFRRVHDGPNPDAEVVEALASTTFTSTPRPVGTWRRSGRDLAVVRTFLKGSADGWQLAMTSLRDLYDRRLPPAECGGDFAPSSAQLGSLVAQLHLALASAFGRHEADPANWLEALEAGLDDLESGDGEGDALDGTLVARARQRYQSLRGLTEAGMSIRIHGDLHLGQLLRNDDGWFVLDFEGEPRVPSAQRRKPSSPLRDVAGMLRSFHYAAEAALLERNEKGDAELEALAQAWEDRNGSAFLADYLNEPGIDDLLPADDGVLYTILGAFELGKAVYEVGYERAHRPEWLSIPQQAVERLLR